MRYTTMLMMRGALWTSLVLLAWPATIQAQTNVHVTTEQPYQRTTNSSNWQNGSLNTSHINYSTPSIPDDKMLVIEQFSARIAVNPGERAVLKVFCSGAPGVFPAYHEPVLTSQGIFGGVRGGLEFLSVSLPLRCYTAGGLGGFQVQVVRNSQAPLPGISSAQSEYAISGFLQDPPAAP